MTAPLEESKFESLKRKRDELEKEMEEVEKEIEDTAPKVFRLRMAWQSKTVDGMHQHDSFVINDDMVLAACLSKIFSVKPRLSVSVCLIKVSYCDKLTFFKTATECFDSLCEDIVKHPIKWCV
jgi:hypothetical protein